MVAVINRTVAAVDKPRLSRQCEEILRMLKTRAHTNRELAGVSLKYTSRISDLRAAGHVITNERLEAGLTLYRLEQPMVALQLELVIK